MHFLVRTLASRRRSAMGDGEFSKTSVIHRSWIVSCYFSWGIGIPRVLC